MEALSVYLQNPVILVVLLIAGFVLLVKGADWLVDGATGLAKRFGVSDLVIGLTIVAFGTSMPEFVVNVVSVAEGTTDLAMTNILGSNIINIFVILGLTALVYPVVSQKQSRDFDIPLSIIAGVLVFAAVAVTLPWESGRGISRTGAIILLGLFIVFLVRAFRNAKSDDNLQEKTSTEPQMHLGKAVLLIIVGLVGLVVGGELIVKSAVQIAVNLGVSDAIIGLTIVALGTSLPELATSVIAAFKKNSDIAMGNVIGSNIFNVFFVLGTSALIKPLPAYEGVELDAFMAALGGALVWLFVKTNKKREVQRWEGAILVAFYAVYLTYRLTNI